jgi:membrane protein
MAATASEPHTAAAQHGERRKTLWQFDAISGRVGGWLKLLLAFARKVNDDWIFNLSGVLAYNLLLSSFPLLMAFIGLADYALGAIAPHDRRLVIRALIGDFPPGVVQGALDDLHHHAGLLIVLGIGTAIVTGSRLFVTLENCLGIVYRLQGRSLVRQNVMAILMLALYIAVVPALLIGSIVWSRVVEDLLTGGQRAGTPWSIRLTGLLGTFVAALVLFGAIYVFVPHRPPTLRGVWRGTVLAAILLAVYELVFPLYRELVLRPSQYGAVGRHGYIQYGYIAGAIIVILVFFYYLAFILLLGAEVNAWTSGQRETAGPLQAILHAANTANERQQLRRVFGRAGLAFVLALARRRTFSEASSVNAAPAPDRSPVHDAVAFHPRAEAEPVRRANPIRNEWASLAQRSALGMLLAANVVLLALVLRRLTYTRTDHAR